MVYAPQKLRNYLLGAHFKMYTDPYALKYFVNNNVFGGKIFRWFLIFHEYDFEVIVKTGWLNVGLDHLSRIENNEEPTNIDEGLPDTQLFVVRVVDEHFADIIYFLFAGVAPEGYTTQQKKELVVRATDFLVISRQLYKMGPDEVLR